MGLEAAHVRWHSHGGPSDVANGLCLCPLHHKFLDLGAIGISDTHRVMVSQVAMMDGAYWYTGGEKPDQ